MKEDNAVDKNVKKNSHLKTLFRTSKKTSKKSTASDKISHAATNGNKGKSELSTKSAKKMEIKPVKTMYSGDEADILEGDDAEDDAISYSRGMCISDVEVLCQTRVFHLISKHQEVE